MADVINPKPAATGLALAALGVAEESKLAGKTLDLNGDGKITADEVAQALKAVKKDDRDGTPGQPRLRLVPGGNNPSESPTELIGTEKNGAKQAEDRTELPLAGVSFKFFDRAIFEAIRVSMAKTGKLPEMPALENEIVQMQMGDIQTRVRERTAELLVAKGLEGRELPSLQGKAA